MQRHDDAARQGVWCEVYEPGGPRLTGGWCARERVDATDGVIHLSQLDHPGTVVQRCLLGPVGRVELRLPGGRLVPAQLVRAAFNATLGRTCTLQVFAAVAGADALAAAADTERVA